MLGGIQQAIWPEYEALRIAVSVAVDVTADAVDDRVVGGNRSVEIHPQDLSLVLVQSRARTSSAVGSSCDRIALHALRSQLLP